jgi:hypothetical protein
MRDRGNVLLARSFGRTATGEERALLVDDLGRLVVTGVAGGGAGENEVVSTRIAWTADVTVGEEWTTLLDFTDLLSAARAFLIAMRNRGPSGAEFAVEWSEDGETADVADYRYMVPAGRQASFESPIPILHRYYRLRARSLAPAGADVAYTVRHIVR